MKNLLLSLLLLALAIPTNAQEISIDGRLKPLLDDFFSYCDAYQIDYYDKLFNLKKIAVVEDLKTSPSGSVLGMVQRNEEGVIENIVVNWIAMLDEKIFKIVAFHEFGHYFLDYHEHVCDDCGIIMARVNSSYFDIANDWDNQVKKLFLDSPAYKKNLKIQNSITTMYREYN